MQHVTQLAFRLCFKRHSCTSDVETSLAPTLATTSTAGRHNKPKRTAFVVAASLSVLNNNVVVRVLTKACPSTVRTTIRVRRTSPSACAYVQVCAVCRHATRAQAAQQRANATHSLIPTNARMLLIMRARDSWTTIYYSNATQRRCSTQTQLYLFREARFTFGLAAVSTRGAGTNCSLRTMRFYTY